MHLSLWSRTMEFRRAPITWSCESRRQLIPTTFILHRCAGNHTKTDTSDQKLKHKWKKRRYCLLPFVAFLSPNQNAVNLAKSSAQGQGDANPDAVRSSFLTERNTILTHTADSIMRERRQLWRRSWEKTSILWARPWVSLSRQLITKGTHVWLPPKLY